MFDKKEKGKQSFEIDFDNFEPNNQGNDSINNSFRSIEMEPATKIQDKGQ
jgi:hypothetical protein